MRKIYMRTLAIIAVLASALTADAQTLTLEEYQNEVTASQAGSYDRVEYLRKAETSNSYLLSFPAQLDGYYFGPDAQRLVVTDMKRDEYGKLHLTTEEMDDAADFLPGTSYVVTPTQDLENIVCLSPAKKSVVNETTAPLLFQVVDERVITEIADITVVDKDSKSPLYDLTGKRLVIAPQQGVYIKNNQKVVK